MRAWLRNEMARLVLNLAVGAIFMGAMVGVSVPAAAAAEAAAGAFEAPLSGWTVSRPGQLEAEADGIWTVRYASPDREPITLAPAEPVLLDEEVTRLSLWFAPVEGDSSVRFKVRDARGQVHQLAAKTTRLSPELVSHDRRQARGWPLWTRAESINIKPPTEAQIRERLLPEDADAAMAMLWPQPLELIGIEIVPAQPGERWAAVTTPEQREQIAAGAGLVQLRGLDASRRHSHDADFYSMLVERARWAQDENEVLFPDELTILREGRFYYQVEIFRGYNGPLVWTRQGEMELKADDPQHLFDNRLELPRLEPGTYVIRIKDYRSNRVYLGMRELNWLVVEGEAPSSLDTGTPYTAWDSGAEGHVYPSDTTSANLTLNISPAMLKRAGGTAECRITIMDFQENVFLEQTVSPTETIEVTFEGKTGHDYYARAELVRDERPYDEQYLHFGFASPPRPAELPSLPEGLPSRDEFFNQRAHLHPQFRFGHRYGSVVFPHLFNFDYEELDRWGDMVVDLGAESVSFKASWADIEPLPGVFRWEVLDEAVRILSDKGLKVVLSKSPLGRTLQPRWIDAPPMRDQYGNIIRGHYRSRRARALVEGWKTFWEAAAIHYREDPDVIGFRIDGGAFFGTPNPESIVTDYSWATQEAYDAWRQARGLEPAPLPELLTLPGVPATRLGPDVSEPWRLFTEFRTESIHEHIRDQMKALRAIDPQRLIMVERRAQPSGIEGIIPDMVKYEAAFKNEGSPGFREASLRSMSVQAGVPYMEELHRHIPSSRSIADATNFWGSHLGHGIFWLNTWNPSFLDSPSDRSFARDFPEVFEYLKQTQPTWEEYIQARFYEPEILIFGSRLDQLVSGHRRGYFDEIAGHDTHDALFQRHQVPVHFANEYADWVDVKRFKLMLVCGEVMPQKAADRILAYANNGGKIVLVGEAGAYVPDAPEPDHYLRERLEKLPNVRTMSAPFVLREARVNSWDAPLVHNEQEVETILAWADIQRPVEVTSDTRPGFQVQMRTSPDRDTIYVAILRNWYGWYRNNIERQAVLEEKFGYASGTATIRAISSGRWEVEKLHRNEKGLGVLETQDGVLSFPIDEAVAGEVQIYRLRRVKQ